MEVKQIIELIEDLLIEHNYLSMPQFGGFVVRETDFTFNKEEKIIYPKKRSVAFNKKLNSDDGVLVLAIAKNEKISQKKAAGIVENFSKKLFFELNTHQELVFGNLGIFSLAKEGNIHFSPNDKNNLDKSFFGLEAVAIKNSSLDLVREEIGETKLEELIIENEGIEEEISEEMLEDIAEVEEESSYSGLWAAAITFILGALFTFILTEPKLKTWESSFNPFEVIDSFKARNNAELDAKIVINSKVPEKKLAEIKPILTENERNQEEENPYFESLDNRIKKTSESNYFIIGGSYKTLEIAEKKVEKFNSKGFYAEILPKKEGEKYFWVAIDSAYNLKEAQEKELKYIKLRTHVWILENF